MNPQDPNQQSTRSQEQSQQPQTLQNQTTPMRGNRLILIIAGIIFIVVLTAGVTAALVSNNGSSKSDEKDTPSSANSDDSEKADGEVSYSGYDKKGRDTQRKTDINSMHAKLEEFYNENIYYPSTFTAADFPGIDEISLTDPIGNNMIVFHEPVASEAAADAVIPPLDDTKTSAGYLYIPYPSGCTNNCTGYELKAFMEISSPSTGNSYIKKSLN